MRPPLSAQTRLYLSLAQRPGKFGTRFHNFLFEALGEDALYLARTLEGGLEEVLKSASRLGVRGMGISMPFKREAYLNVDRHDESAVKVGAANTLVWQEDSWVAYNSDYLAARKLLSSRWPTDAPVVLLGAGGMARAVLAALTDLGAKNITLVSRRPNSAGELAALGGWKWSAGLEGIPPVGAWLINATPIGMAPDPQGILPFPPAWVKASVGVMDCVANPPETSLIHLAREQGKITVSGHEIQVLQALEQFRLYTGKKPPVELVQAAVEYVVAN